MKASLFNYSSRWWLPGLIAGAVFLFIAMVSGALATTAWAMPNSIAQVVGVSVPTGYGFALWPLLVGVVVHLTISIGLGALFTAIALWRRLHGWVLVVVAFVFGALEPSVAIWVFLHNLVPETTFRFFLGALPWWGSVFGHCMYGLVLGLFLLLGPLAATEKAQQPLPGAER